MRSTMASAVRSPMPGMLSTSSKRRARSSCGRSSLISRTISAARCLSSLRNVWLTKRRCRGDVFQPRLLPRDVFFQMLYKGKVIGQRLEPQIGRDRGWLNHRRTGRDDRRVDAVVLGAFEMQPGERLALQRLQPQHHEARLAKIVDDATL